MSDAFDHFGQLPGASNKHTTTKEKIMIDLARRLAARLRLALAGDEGMSTAEYAIGTIAAAAFAAVLYAVVSGDGVVSALTSIVQRALTANF
ncbi:MAG TPA: DUF4244 domain-containing protein [Pseudonocardia sp.]|uniref:DUF4244 domain-containing protein n=1 Tax=Pseudonocardia sp. TaxID=60912 RepID=UPI002F3FBCB3